MRICIVCEGSYPYVVGGVSSWIQQLIKGFPEHEFVIFSIGAEKKLKGHFRYELPSNVTEVIEVFFDDEEEHDRRRAPKMNMLEQQAFVRFMHGNTDAWGPMFDFFTRKKFNITDFLMSREFFELAKELYATSYSNTLFVDFIWTIRSMYLTLFYVMTRKIPRADLYHAVATGYSGVIAAMGKHFYGAPFLLTEHGIYTREREEEIIKADWVRSYFKDLWIGFFHSMSQCAYYYADKTVTLFENSRTTQIEIGCPTVKTMVIPNGVKSANFKNITYKRPDGYADIGTVTRVTPIKDIKTMIHAFALVKNKLPNAHLHILGQYDENQEYYEECLQLIEELEVKDVRFYGSVQVTEYLGKLDLLLLTSISEGMPLAILEGLAAGVPFVTTNVGCCEELLYGLEEDYIGEAGIVVPVMNPERIADAVVTLMRDPDRREEMGKNGRERVMTHYTDEVFLNGYRELYESFSKMKPVSKK